MSYLDMFFARYCRHLRCLRPLKSSKLAMAKRYAFNQTSSSSDLFDNAFLNGTIFRPYNYWNEQFGSINPEGQPLKQGQKRDFFEGGGERQLQRTF